MSVHDDIMDRPLEPGKRYTVSVVLLESQMMASRGDLTALVIEHALSKLLGPRGERVKLPIGKRAIRVSLSAQVEPWPPDEERGR